MIGKILGIKHYEGKLDNGKEYNSYHFVVGEAIEKNGVGYVTKLFKAKSEVILPQLHELKISKPYDLLNRDIEFYLGAVRPDDKIQSIEFIRTVK